MKTFVPLTFSLFLGLGAGCASVPSDAPDELQSAQASIKDANKIDADDIVPKTMKNAKSELGAAVDLYKDSKDSHDEAKLASAKEKALTAKKMATNAAALTADVRAADGSDLQAFVDEKSAVSALAASQAELQDLRNHQTQAAASVPAFAVRETVAFFPTAKSAAVPQAALAQLSDTMKANAGLTVTLVGHADNRGPEAYNQKLSEQRAQAVAAYLQGQGIAQNRIVVEARGKLDATASRDPSQLQIDRGVEAQLNSLAH